MATVFQAYQPKLERYVALKILNHLGAENQAFLAGFRQEAKAIASLRHPNILTIYDYGEEDGQAYIAMEYVAQGAVSDYLAGKPMSWPEAALLIIPIAQALAYAHAQGIIHCDVKPANILLPRQEWPLLADFGLSKLRSVGGNSSNAPGLMSGTPAYAAPEQVVGREVDRRSDIYSLALVLYEMLTGRVPFAANTPAASMIIRLQEAPAPPSMFNHRIAPPLERAILQALAREADKRFPDMDAFIEALMAVPNTPIPTHNPPPSTAAYTSHTNVLPEQPPQTVIPHLIVTGTEAILLLPEQNNVVLGRIDPRSPRQPDIDLVPHGGVEAGVSRLHARLLQTKVGWLLEDLESTNGTSLNMAPVEPGHALRLHSGDVIRCGRLMLVFFEK